MINKNICSLGKHRFEDPVYGYVFCAAAIAFFYMILHVFLLEVYEYLLIVPCFMFLGVMAERGVTMKGKRYFILPCALACWVVIVMIKRSLLELLEPTEVGLDLIVYLFAFPLASLLHDGDEKKALKIFAWAYLAGAAVLATEGMLLSLGFLRNFIPEHLYWDGGRLVSFWHPNVTGCYLMVGIILCTTFISSAKSVWAKLGLCVLLVMMSGAMALGRCRTTIILTGGYLGSLAFFMAIKHGRKWFLPGVAAALVLLVAFYAGATRYYEANYEALLESHVQQYEEQKTNETAAVKNPEKPAESAAKKPENTREEKPPIKVDEKTGEIKLVTTSPQGTLEKDAGTLNNRTRIWRAAFVAIRENPEILLWGVPNPGRYVTDYFDSRVSHMHNGWMECLVGLGLVGFVIAVLFTVVTIWNCLIILLKYQQDIWKRNTVMLTLCLLAASFLEPYLFYTWVDYHLVELLFFLCAGYLAHWQEEDNRRIWNAVRSKLPQRRK